MLAIYRKTEYGGDIHTTAKFNIISDRNLWLLVGTIILLCEVEISQDKQ